MVYYRIAARAYYFTPAGSFERYNFVGNILQNIQQVLYLMNIYVSPHTLVIGASTPERLIIHLERFNNGEDSVCIVRDDLVHGTPFGPIQIREAEALIYDGVQPKTVESSALDPNRLGFARWLVQTGRLSEEVEE